MNGNYGVPRDIFAKLKIIGVYVVDGAIVIGSLLLSFVFATAVFPTTQLIQMILFVILSGIISLYLVLPTNGGKKNVHSIFLFIRRRKKRFQSIDFYGRWIGK